MNRYSLSIEWEFYGKYEVWKMIVVTNDSELNLMNIKKRSFQN